MRSAGEMDQADAELRATICKVSLLNCRKDLLCKQNVCFYYPRCGRTRERIRLIYSCLHRKVRNPVCY